MNKTIRVGDHVINRMERAGKVLTVDYNSKVAVMRGTKCYWTDKVDNLVVLRKGNN